MIQHIYVAMSFHLYFPRAYLSWSRHHDVVYTALCDMENEWYRGCYDRS